MAEAIAGMCYFNADGQNYALVGEASYTVSSFTRESLIGSDGFHGFKKKVAAGVIIAHVRNMGSLQMSVLAAWENITAQLELANGKTVVGSGMFLTTPPTADAEEANIELHLEGPYVIEA